MELTPYSLTPDLIEACSHALLKEYLQEQRTEDAIQAHGCKQLVRNIIDH